MRYLLRPVTESDAPLLRALFEDARRADFELLPAPLRADLVAMQWRAREADWRRRFPNAVDAIVVSAGEAVGRLLLDRGPAETRVVDVALLPRARGLGLGAALLGALCAEGLPVVLSVHAENPAGRLYARLGFVETEAAPPYRTLRFAPPGGHANT
jgi:GNAT superfamily N-acetyltransferase